MNSALNCGDLASSSSRVVLSRVIYRHDIATGIDLAAHVADFIDEFNTIRPHEALDWRRPIDAHLEEPTLKPRPPESEQGSRLGTRRTRHGR